MKIAFVAAVLLVLVGIVLLLRREKDAPIGFREAVWDPDAWREAMDERENERRAIETENLGDDQLRQCVLDLLDPERARLARARLEHHGKRSIPFLVAVLGDDRFKTFDEALSGPFDIVCNLLRPHVSPGMVVELAPLFAHAESGVRKEAALLLGKIGTETAVKPVTAALDDEDDYVRSYAMMGIGDGMREKMASRAFLDAIFEPIVRLLDRPTVDVSGDAPRTLLEIDRERATAVLLDPRFLRAGNTQLSDILEALNDDHVVVPADRLMAILKELEALPKEYRHHRAGGQALVALAASDPVIAEPLIRKAMDADDGTLREIATEAFALLNGLRDVHDTVFELYKKVDYEIERLPQPVQHHLRVRFLVDEVNNGGYSQYFFNGTADEALKTPAALRAIGAEREAAGLEKAFRLFGKDGPSPDREVRQKQLERLAGSSDDDFDDFEEKFPPLPEDVEKLLLLHAIANKETFR